jgi:hypothetical protein
MLLHNPVRVVDVFATAKYEQNAKLEAELKAKVAKAA